MTRSHLFRLALPIALIALAPAAPAQTYTGANADMDWNQAADWSPGIIPNSATAAVVFDNTGVQFGFGLNIYSSVQSQSLTFNNTTGNYKITSSSGQTLSGVTSIIVGSGVAATDTISLNANSTGSLVYPSGGSLTITNNAALGSTPTLVIGTSTVIGTPGAGGITVAGTGYTRISGSFAGSGNQVINGLTKNGTGQLDLNPSVASNLGMLTVNAGSVTVGSGNLILTTTAGDPLSVGSNSAATLTISGGGLLSTTASSTSVLDVIDGPAGATAVVTGAGSKLSVGSELVVGAGGGGSLTTQNAATTTADLAIVGNGGGSTGTATVTGAGSQFKVSTNLFVGYFGSGALAVQNGGTVTSGNAFLGLQVGSTGVATVSGIGSALSTGTLFLGANGTDPGGTGQMTIANGGAVTVSNATYFGSSASSIAVDGGTLTTGSLSLITGTPTILLSDPAGGSALTVGTGNSSSAYAGPIADAAGGPGTVTKIGTGTLTLTGVLTNTGGYTSAAGQIEFSGAVVDPGPGSLTAALGATIQYDNNARIFGGFLRGSGTQIVTGGATFSGTTSFNSTVINATGAGSFVNFTNGGTMTVSGGGSKPVSFNGFTNQGSGAITIGAGSAINAADFQTYGMLTLTPNTTAAPTILTNTGTTPLFFNGGSQTFIGTPQTADATGQAILDYVDLHGNNAIVAGGLVVNNGGIFDTAGAGTGTIIAEFGALVKGAGFYQNTVKTQNGGKFQTGNSPGSATFGNFVFGPGGVNNYVFAIDDATGTAGPSPNASGLVSGWGLIKAVQAAIGSGTTSGNFTWTATPRNPLTVAIDTLVNPTTVGTDIAGPMADFDRNQSYSWTAARWSGVYAGPTDAAMLDADTSFDTSGFANPIAGTFGWSLDQADQTLSLVYKPSAVPESGTLALVGLVAAAGWWRRRGWILADTV